MERIVGCVRLPHGVELPYAEQGDPSGVPLVLLHGLAGTWRSFELVLDRLPSAVHALAFTQRGHGDATKPATGYRIRDFARDLEGFLDELELEAAVIAGGSSGGFTARRFAIDHPDRTRGLVLLGSPARLRGKPQVEEVWESTLSTMEDPVDRDFVRSFMEMTMPPSVPQSLVNDLLQQSFKMPARVWRETNRGLLEDNSIEAFPRIGSRTLIIWGDQDSISSKEEQEAMAEAIPNARLVIYAGAGHTLHLEKPGRVAADVTAFVEDVGG